MEIRAFSPTDLAGVLACITDSLPVDPISESRFVRQVLLDPNFRAEGMPVAVVDGKVIGFCLSIARQVPLENAADDSERGYITLFAVLPKFQRRGAGTAMLGRAEAFLRSHGRTLCMVSPYAPGYFTCGVDVQAYANGLQFFADHGYAEVYRPIAMEIALWDFAVPPRVRDKQLILQADGVTIEPYRSALTLPLLDFAAREFAGDWVRYARETMGKIQLGENPSRLMIAHQAGKVIGYSHHNAERFGPIGVAADQRGRGVGQVLMYETLIAQRLAGFRTAWFLWSDDKTAAQIYSAAGFKEVRRFALLKKTL